MTEIADSLKQRHGLPAIYDGPLKLCDKVDATYTGHFTGPAFNNGSLAGHTGVAAPFSPACNYRR